MRVTFFRSLLTASAVLASLVLTPAPAHAERIKDLAQVAGVRGNQLVGYGLVVAWTAAATAPARRPSRCRA
jgi:flagellar P-ring protein precursor FlgI